MPIFEIYTALVTYSAFVFFVVVLFIRIGKYARAPLHLRWELYPVPQEPGHEHGGSFLEKVDWWKANFKEDRVSELKELLQEMLFIKRLYQHKRKFWYFSFLFHGGLYLILAWFVLLLIGALTQLFYVPVSLIQGVAYSNPWSALVFYVTVLCGYVGVSAATVGDIGLLATRYSDSTLRDLSSTVDYFNLIFALAILISGITALFNDPSFNIARTFMMYLISGAGYFISVNAEYTAILSGIMNPLNLIQLSLLCAFLIYLPFTRMTHFFGKYFTYHKVLWDSEPEMANGVIKRDIEGNVNSSLNYKIPWAAQHVPKEKKWKELSANEQ